MNERLFLENRRPRPLYFEMVGECQWRFADLMRTMIAVYLKGDEHTDSDFNQMIIDNNYEYFKFVEKLKKLNVCDDVVSYFNKIRIRRNVLSHSVVRVTSQNLLAHLTHQVKLHNPANTDKKRRENEQYSILGYLIDASSSPNSYIHITYSFLQDMIFEIKNLSQHLDNVLEMRQKGLDEKMLKPEPVTIKSIVPTIDFLFSPEFNKIEDNCTPEGRLEKQRQIEAFFDKQLEPFVYQQ